MLINFTIQPNFSYFPQNLIIILVLAVTVMVKTLCYSTSLNFKHFTVDYSDLNFIILRKLGDFHFILFKVICFMLDFIIPARWVIGLILVITIYFQIGDSMYLP